MVTNQKTALAVTFKYNLFCYIMSTINIQDMYSGLELDEESEYRINKSVWYCYVVKTFENSHKN
jgi:hypothetical protein